ncbi:MAG: histidine phosphatase family protein [Anaerolineales bacterium]|nr:histidine phosphatase family protein [Anaerolineales bacterium]
MAKLLLVRHAAPAADPCVAPSQWPLSAVGRASCAPLAEALRPYLPAALYASREAKAAETAALVARALGVRFAPGAGLHEHARATDDWLDSPAEFQARMETLYARPSAVVFGTESADAAHARFAGAVAALRAEGPAGNLVLFTHGTVLTLLVARANPGLDPLAFWRTLGQPAIVVLDRDTLALESVIEKVAADA